MLITRGRHPAFQAAWSDIKKACLGGNSGLALARIRSTANRRRTIESIRTPIEHLGSAVRDEEIAALIRCMEVVPLGFDLSGSDDEERAIAQCRSLLASGELSDASHLWKKLVSKARDSRLGHGTITLAALWSELRTQFALKDHPDFAASWRTLISFTADYRANVETALPTGVSFARAEESKLAGLIANERVVLLFGDSGIGKSALVKSTLDTQFANWVQVWLGPDELELMLKETERPKIGLTYPLPAVLGWTTKQRNVLVMDSAERLDSSVRYKAQQLIAQLAPQDGSGVWHVVIVGQTESRSEGYLLAFASGTPPPSVELGPTSTENVIAALWATERLRWLASQDDVVTVLTNPRALAWVMQAESQFQREGGSLLVSQIGVADQLWKFWTGGRLPLQNVVVRLAEREAGFEHSFALSELDSNDAAILETRPIELPLKITSRNRIEFRHDLAADWARFQRLKEIADDTAKWANFAPNPLWGGALRMLGQFLLREANGDRCGWDVALDVVEASEATRPAADVLLDALCLDPFAESFLNQRTDLLFRNHGRRLNRLIQRFHHIATMPNVGQDLVNRDPSLRLYMESQIRIPIVGRWPAVARFLAAHRETISKLTSPVIAGLCERWLTTTPVELVTGAPMPYRREFAALALATARCTQFEQISGTMYTDGAAKPIYSAALAAAPDLLDDVAAWALEMVRRRPLDKEVAERVGDYRRQQAETHRERTNSDPEYRVRRRGLFATPNSLKSHEGQQAFWCRPGGGWN